MNKIFIITFLSFTYFGLSQTTYLSKYKIITVKSIDSKEPKGQIEDFILNTIKIEFCSNDKFCFIKDTKSIDQPGLNVTQSDNSIYINYKNGAVIYDLLDNNVETYRKLKFKKTRTNILVLGMQTTLYTSEDGNINIYTVKKLPWYIQPCIINSNQFNEGIVKFENLKTNKGLELIEYNKIKYSNDIDNIYKKVISKKIQLPIKVVDCPFFKSNI
jgi:hypothetical protein